MEQFIFKKENDILFGMSKNIPVCHGFSTRIGGVSVLAHTAGMNLAFGRGDDEKTVRENMRLFCLAIGVDDKTVVSARQIHSARVLTVTRKDAALENVEADGFVSADEKIALCVKTADCVPILFCDEDRRVIGACHAGWRGSAAGIAEITVQKMCALGANPHRIQAAIGPCIHVCCYEVSQDFYDSVAQLRGEDFARRNIVTAPAGKMHADLVGMNLEILGGAGIPEKNISVCGRCTCCEPDVFFSHRASGGKRGTMAAVISL